MEGTITPGGTAPRRPAHTALALAALAGLIVLLGPALPQLVTPSRHHAGAGHVAAVVKSAVTTAEHAVTSYRVDDAPVVVTASLALLFGLVGVALATSSSRTRGRVPTARRIRGPPAPALR